MLGHVIEERRIRGCAYRHSGLVCERLVVTAVDDGRVGLAPIERRYLTVRFLDGLDGRLRAELTRLVRRRGAAARRAAETLEPIELVVDDADGSRLRIQGRLEPPLLRHGGLREIDFGIRVWP